MHPVLSLPAQFINWTTGRDTKLPVNAQGQTIDAHDPANWLTYEQAVANGSFGVAFVLTENDPYFFIDLDKCTDANGQWKPEAVAIYQNFTGAMGEISQSGTGLHVLGKCQPGMLQDRKNKWDGWCEFYTQKRFVAFGSTGWEPIGEWQPDADFTQNLLRVVPQRTVMGELPDGVDERYTGAFTDDELIEKMCNQRQGAGALFSGKATAADLWNGNAEALARSYPAFDGKGGFDHSSADAALCSHLAFWTGKDMPRMDRLFRRSALMRPKWERDDYRTKTVSDAARMADKVYDLQGPTQAPTALSSAHMMMLDQMVDHFAGCVYIMELDKILTPTGDLLKQQQFKAFYGGHKFQMETTVARVSDLEKNAWIAFTENRAMQFPKVRRAFFDPHKPPLQIEGDGVNTYRPDENVVFTPGDVSLFLQFMEKLLPDERDRRIMLSWMAATVQHHGSKFQWSPVIQGVEGNGKSFLGQALAHAIGMRFAHWPMAENMTEKFNSYLEGALIVIIEEIHMAGRREVLDHLKPLITNNHIEIRAMNTDKRMVRNFANFMFFTNYKDAIIKSHNDRRYCIFYAAQQSKQDLERDGMTMAFFRQVFDWAEKQGGYGMIAEYLRTYPIDPEFNPAGDCRRAPETSMIKEVLMQSRGQFETILHDAIDDQDQGFRGGFVSSIKLANLIEDHTRRKPNTQTVNKLLEAEGYIKIGRSSKNIALEQGRPNIYVRRGQAVDPNRFTDQYCEAQGYLAPPPP